MSERTISELKSDIWRLRLKLVWDGLGLVFAVIFLGCALAAPFIDFDMRLVTFLVFLNAAHLAVRR